MRRAGVLGVASLLSAALFLVPPALARSRSNGAPGPVCPRVGSLTVAADQSGQLYSDTVPGGNVWGCLYGHRAFDFFRFGSETPGVGMVAMVGPIVAFEVNGEQTGYSYDTIIVASLAAGRKLKKVPDEPGIPIGDVPAYATGLVLKADGAVAWVLSDHEIYADDANGYRLLASNPAIATGSLALAGSTLYWLQDGTPQTATLH